MILALAFIVSGCGDSGERGEIDIASLDLSKDTIQIVVPLPTSRNANGEFTDLAQTGFKDELTNSPVSFNNIYKIRMIVKDRSNVNRLIGESDYLRNGGFGKVLINDAQDPSKVNGNVEFQSDPRILARVDFFQEGSPAFLAVYQNGFAGLPSIKVYFHFERKESND